MSTPRKQFCENCGQRLPEGARFCEICGRPVEGFHKRSTVVTYTVDSAAKKSGKHQAQPVAPSDSDGASRLVAPASEVPRLPSLTPPQTGGKPSSRPVIRPAAGLEDAPESQTDPKPADRAVGLGCQSAPHTGDRAAGMSPASTSLTDPPSSGASASASEELPPAVRIEVVKKKVPKKERAAKPGEATPPSGIPSYIGQHPGKGASYASATPARIARAVQDSPADSPAGIGAAVSPTAPTTKARIVDAGSEKPTDGASMPHERAVAIGAGAAKPAYRILAPVLAAAIVSLAIIAGIAAYSISSGNRKGKDTVEIIGSSSQTGKNDSAAESVTASIGGRVKATASAAKGKSALKLSEVPAPAAIAEGTFPLASLGAYEVSLSDAAEFENPVAIEIRYDPAILSPSQPASEQLMVRFLENGASNWIWLRSSVDEKTKVVRVAVPRPGKFELICLTAEPAPGGIEKAKWAAYHTPEFVIVYDGRAIGDGAETRDSAWKSKGGGRFPVAGLKAGRESDETTSGYRRDVPECIQDLGYFLEHVLFAYGKEGFNLPPRPVLVRAETQPAMVEWRRKTPDRISVNMAGATSAEALQRASARELFEAIQRLDYGTSKIDDAKFAMLRWWLAATAEYAACRVGWNLKVEAADAAQLSHPIAGTSAMPNLDRGRVHFVEYLVGLGVSFPGLHKAVTVYSGAGDPVFRPIGAILRRATGADFPDIHRSFAAYFLFSSEGPLGGRDPSKTCAEKADVFPLAKETGAQAEPISHALKVLRGYTAAVWAVRPEAMPTASRKIVVEATDLSGRVAADLYLLEGNRLAKVPPRRSGTLRERGDRKVVEAGTGDVLYVVACGTSEDEDGAVKVRVSDFGGIAMTMEPAEIVNREGKMTHEFAVTVRRIPPEVRSLLCEWDFGFRTDRLAGDVAEGEDRTATIKISCTFPREGRYVVKAKLFDTTGGLRTLVAEKSGTVTISLPSVRMYIERPAVLVEPGEEVRFDAPIINGPVYARYEWDFGDASGKRRTSTNHASYKFDKEGEYIVTVRAFDASRRENAVAEATSRVFVRRTLGVDTPEEVARLVAAQRLTRAEVKLTGKAVFEDKPPGKVDAKDKKIPIGWACSSYPQDTAGEGREKAAAIPIIWKGRIFFAAYRHPIMPDRDEGSHKKSETVSVAILGVMDRSCAGISSLHVRFDREEIGTPNPHPAPKEDERRRNSAASNWERRESWGFAATDLPRVSPAEIGSNTKEMIFSAKGKEPVARAVSNVFARESSSSPEGTSSCELTAPFWDDSSELIVRLSVPSSP